MLKNLHPLLNADVLYALRAMGHGDELVKLKVMLPTGPDPELETFLSTWTARKSYDPRRDMQP